MVDLGFRSTHLRCVLCDGTDKGPRHVVQVNGMARGYHIDCHSRMNRPCPDCVLSLDQLHAMGRYLNDNDRETQERERRKEVPEGAPAWLEVNEFTSALKSEDHAWLRGQEIWLPEPKPVPAPVEKRGIRRTASGNNPIVLVLFFATFAATMASLLTPSPVIVTVSLIITMVGLSSLIDRKKL